MIPCQTTILISALVVATTACAHTSERPGTSSSKEKNSTGFNEALPKRAHPAQDAVATPEASSAVEESVMPSEDVSEAPSSAVPPSPVRTPKKAESKEKSALGVRQDQDTFQLERLDHDFDVQLGAQPLSCSGARPFLDDICRLAARICQSPEGASLQQQERCQRAQESCERARSRYEESCSQQ